MQMHWMAERGDEKHIEETTIQQMTLILGELTDERGYKNWLKKMDPTLMSIWKSDIPSYIVGISNVIFKFTLTYMAVGLIQYRQ